VDHINEELECKINSVQKKKKASPLGGAILIAGGSIPPGPNILTLT
jgi:hypothetical protein